MTQAPYIQPSPKISLLSIYGVTHGLIDAACASLVFGLVWQSQLTAREYFLLVVGYNMFAFAFQPLCGLLSDAVHKPSITAAFGIVLTGLSILMAPFHPFIAVAFAGLGNAFFHVGGGAMSLMVSPGHAGPPGLFVAPGALGIAIGALVGRNGLIPPMPFLSLLIVALVAVLIVKTPQSDSATVDKLLNVRWPILIGSFLLISIMMRSLVGFSAGIPWQGHKTVLLLIVGAAFAGKALGGIISDSFGWLAISTTVLLVSAPLLALGFKHSYGAVVGMLLFQMTMPVTLAALFTLLPKRPGFAFGLACLALIIGAAPVFSPLKYLFASWYVVTCCIIVSTVFLFTALYLLQGGRREGVRANGMFENKDLLINGNNPELILQKT